MNIGDFSPDYQIFYDFLHANNALEAFISQCSNSDTLTSRPIDHGLNWSRTREGSRYWSDLQTLTPRIKLRITDFKEYCKLRSTFDPQAPYEYW